MIKVVLVIHLIIAAAMIAIVLMQKSEGGALGIGGGGGGGFLTGRGTANLLTRITAGLALGFFITSLTLTIMATSPDRGGSRFQNLPAGSGEGQPPATGGGETGAGGNLLDRLKQRQGGDSGAPAIPQNQ